MFKSGLSIQATANANATIEHEVGRRTDGNSGHLCALV